MSEPKNLFTSKTLWLNAIAAIGAIALEASDYLPDNYAKHALAVVAVVNIILRFRTDAPVSFKARSRAKRQ